MNYPGRQGARTVFGRARPTRKIVDWQGLWSVLRAPCTGSWPCRLPGRRLSEANRAEMGGLVRRLGRMNGREASMKHKALIAAMVVGLVAAPTAAMADQRPSSSSSNFHTSDSSKSSSKNSGWGRGDNWGRGNDRGNDRWGKPSWGSNKPGWGWGKPGSGWGKPNWGWGKPGWGWGHDNGHGHGHDNGHGHGGWGDDDGGKSHGC